jgi:hypothetical protein
VFEVELTFRCGSEVKWDYPTIASNGRAGVRRPSFKSTKGGDDAARRGQL